MKLSVIIPVYNEAQTLAAIVEQVQATGLAYEIIIVDDGSSDHSAAIVTRFQKEDDDSLILLRHKNNQGKGAAIRTGLTAVSGDIVLVQDADLEYDPADYPTLLAPFTDPNVEVVYGSRNLRRNPKSTLAFYWGGRLLSWVTNLLYGSRITDEATGYKVIKTNLLRDLGLETDGFEFCPEVTGKLLRRGVKIREVPISYQPRSREEGKKIRWSDGLMAIWTLLKYRFFRGCLKGPQIPFTHAVIKPPPPPTGGSNARNSPLWGGRGAAIYLFRHLLRDGPPQPKSSSPFVSMTLILLLAALLRFPWLAEQSIAFDESFSLVVSQTEWAPMFQAILSDGVHPPLFYIIHKGALALWGLSEFGQRFSAGLFSLLTVALVYKAGQIIFNEPVGVFSALLLALNPLQIWFAQEARMYSLLSALTLLSMTLFWQAVRLDQRRYWVGLTIVNALIFGLHYFGFLIPTIQFVFIIITLGRNHSRLRPWTISQVVAFIPLLPWLILTAQREAQTFGIGFLQRPSPLDLLVTFWNLAMGTRSGIFFWPLTWLALLTIGAALLLALRPLPPHKFIPRQGRWLVGLWVILPPLLTWVVSQRRAFYADRYLSFVIPGLVLLLAFGVTRLTHQRGQLLLLSGLLIGSGYGLISTRLDPAFWKDDWRGTAAYISHNEQAGDAILLYTTHIKFVFAYYYQGEATPQPISLNLENFPIDPLVKGHKRAWVVYPYTRRPTHYPMQPLLPAGYWHNDPKRNPLLVTWLEQRAAEVIDYHHFRGVEVWLVDLETK